MSQALANKYRPYTLQDVVEQNLTVNILQRQLVSGQIKNTYLFCGPSGCGKTTIARCFARAINNNSGEPIEIDAASNNGVDQVRAIIESANQRSLTSTYKIFIIDEAHAITSAGWQAFLKSIEEPPLYTIYIFCTTEPNKIPETILNRVQRYNISKISVAGIKDRLIKICQAENFTNYEETCDLISKISDGKMRDAITYLDQCADLSTDLNIETTKGILGDISYETMMKLTNMLIDGNEAGVLNIIDSVAESGRDLRQFINSYLGFVLDLTKFILFKDIHLTQLPEYLLTIQDTTVNIQYTTGIENGLNWFNLLSDRLLEIKSEIKYDTAAKNTIEAFLLKTCRGM